MELFCKVQNYAWGMKGMGSSVSQLTKAAHPEVEIDENLPYAELWMGTHGNGPSVIKATGDLLSSHIAKYPECLGSNIREKFGSELCFLFKVLSVGKALSIQAHPEKSHAERLHAARPEVYKDPNHKPEMAIALTSFEALCGFRPSEQIQNFLNELPELRGVVGESAAGSLTTKGSEAALKECFSALMNAPKETVTRGLDDLSRRLQSLDPSSAASSPLLPELFLRLHSQFPGDAGCFSIYFLNRILLQPGEAMFLGPNVIHAYLSGDCIECMAGSDNVVRAGLTPKYQDVDTLVAMLEYEMSAPETRKFEGAPVDQHTTLYNPPVPDFAVQKLQTESSAELHVTKEASASLLIVVAGTGTDVALSPPTSGGASPPGGIGRGSVLFVEAGQTLSFKAQGEFLAFRALCV